MSTLEAEFRRRDMVVESPGGRERVCNATQYFVSCREVWEFYIGGLPAGAEVAQGNGRRHKISFDTLPLAGAAKRLHEDGAALWARRQAHKVGAQWAHSLTFIYLY